MKKSTPLLQLLCQIKDKRRKQGTRHSQANILLTVILGTMSGYQGYRGMEDFCHRYSLDLTNILGNPKHGVASYSSIRRVLMEIDFNIVSHKFYQWIRGKTNIKRNEWMQIDGKSLKGTITEYDNKMQNFVSLVSLFMNRTGLTIQSYHMENRKQSEITIVQDLIANLELRNVVISMDALHTKKNSCPNIIN